MMVMNNNSGRGEEYFEGLADGIKLGRIDGKEDAIDECVSILKKELEFYENREGLIVKLEEQLKRQNNEH